MPNVSTRVSEYVPEIISYIDTLMGKGVAYESNGSVYFSVSEFEAQGHVYGKLMPEQIGNSELLAEGEGALGNPYILYTIYYILYTIYYILYTYILIY
jgi:cysteinyl-tRNA synthetase